MTTIANPSTGYITMRCQQLRRRFEPEHRVMRELDLWRNIDEYTLPQLTEAIWGPGSTGKERITVALPYIEAMTDTLVAIFAAREPKFAAIAKNTRSLPATQQANEVERIIRPLYHKLNDNRDLPLGDEAAEMIFHRAKLITKVLYLSPEQRGEVRAPLDELDLQMADELPLDETRIVEEGSFPVTLDILDPLDCFYQLGPDKQPVEFIHEVGLHWDDVLALYPDIATNPEFADRVKLDADGNSAYLDGQVTVTDYWNQKVHAVMIAGQFYKKPTPHGKKRLPFMVEIVRARPRPRATSTTGYSGGGTATVRYREATPFCKAMLEPIKAASRAESILASHVRRMAFTPIIHTGIRTDRPSFWVERKQASDGSKMGLGLQYTLKIDASQDAPIIPMTEGEELRPMDPPRIADHVQQFLASRSADLEMVSVARSFLTGQMEARLSGYSAIQQKQLSVARWEPYHEALNRGLSRTIMRVIETLRDEWDREPDVPFLIENLTGGAGPEIIPITREMLGEIMAVRVTTNPMVPIDRQQEWGVFFQANQVGAMSLLEVIEKMGESEDPEDTLMRVAFERVALQDPQFMMALAAAYARKNNIPLFGQGQQAPAPPAPAPPMDPAMAGMPAGAPADPAMAQAGMMGAPGMGAGTPGQAGGPPPEELINAILRMQGGRG